MKKKEIELYINKKDINKIIKGDKHAIITRSKMKESFKGWINIGDGVKIYTNDIRKLEYIRLGVVYGYMVDPKGDKNYNVGAEAGMSFNEISEILENNNGYIIYIKEVKYER